MVKSPWPKVTGALVAPVINPSHASVAVGAAGNAAEHWPITSGRVATFGTGASVSVTVTTAEQEAVALWLSVAVSVTDVWPNGYGPEGVCVIVMASPLSGSEEPSSMDALAVQVAPA